ncbi:hypothetical protein NDU88_003750 [Pleurodeles waltl]|uniref:Uncharacterized protein n=1 Tax=Pleurodeles waltl TaxID=8319 RepID=A0AAV7UF82_PLEWA|nr:hypothetical protein NDU88_003750 [Pleurodeles waltl]
MTTVEAAVHRCDGALGEARGWAVGLSGGAVLQVSHTAGTPKTVVCWERPWTSRDPGPILGGARQGLPDSVLGSESAATFQDNGFPARGREGRDLPAP